MTKIEDKHDPFSSKYPAVLMKLYDSIEAVQEASQLVRSKDIRLMQNDSNLLLEEPDATWLKDWTYSSGCHDKHGMRQYHVTFLIPLKESLKPGDNYIYIHPLMQTDFPFRMTAIIVCQACSSFGYGIPS